MTQASEEAIQEFLDTWTAPEGLEEDLRELLDRVSRQALERAAKVAELHPAWARTHIAEAIRQLIPEGR